MKKYYVLSGLGLRDNNRGTAALGYGAFSFLRERGYIDDGSRLLAVMSSGRPFRKKTPEQKAGRPIIREIKVGSHQYYKETVIIPWWQWLLYKLTAKTFPFTKFRRVLDQLAFVAAINGGDGFSDIYNTATFHLRLPEILQAMRIKKPVIMLPQTLGPFKDPGNAALAEKILRYASAIYVRDDNFIKELDRMGLKYEQTNDLSYYMKPEPWDIVIDTPNAIGINVSGLAYSNTFRTLAGQFSAYPELIDRLISHFQAKGKTVYLIPHSYHFGNPEKSNDDIEACQLAYDRLQNKDRVVFINKDLVSPQVKYLISRMSFFCGTRMHANYAAIFTKVPVFGFAYSYKFKGAFERNGIFNRTAMINNITVDQIDDIIHQVEVAYEEDVVQKFMNGDCKL